MLPVRLLVKLLEALSPLLLLLSSSSKKPEFPLLYLDVNNTYCYFPMTLHYHHFQAPSFKQL